MTDRDTFAAAALTALLAMRRYEADAERWAETSYELADAMLRERAKTNHDAVPAAIAVSDEDRTDKAATSHRRDRSGDTPVTKPMPKEKRAEVSDRSKPIKDGIDPAAYSGDIVQQLRRWRGRHLAHVGELFEAAADEIDRLRTVMYRIVDEDCTVAIQNGTFYADGDALFEVPHTPTPQTTPGECSTPREGTSEPVAWWLRGTEYDTGCEYEYVSLLKENAEAAAAEGGTVVPLYLQPSCQDFSQKNLTFTESETLCELRDEAAQYADEIGLSSSEVLARQRIIDGLLERLK